MGERRGEVECDSRMLQFSIASKEQYRPQWTVISEISEIRKTLVVGLLAGRLLSHILTLHVEEKGGQRRTQGYHSSSPSLMTGWRGGVEAEEK